MNVDPESWPELSRLMDEWLDLPAERRDEWLTNLDPRHAKLVPTLRELLAQPAPGFLDTLPSVGDSAPSHMAAGTTIGPYRLVRKLGHGGMGVVWLATREDGTLIRDVALKFPHGVWPGQPLADRFTRERDILARFADARIARLYDAGVTDQGQPYLVLEYVEGEPITTYCDRIRLDIRGRLNLFLEVLGAVQYAHTNLIVHRDLKPSNILVTTDGQVRLLDFGIAKLLAEGESGETEMTRAGGRPLTPEFASPEQIAGGPITTATDVYSLGILLHELLTGTRPERSSVARPSQAVPSKKLAAVLRGDLDTIVLKAIQPDPQSRYTTADSFAQDIDRYLAGRPILARRESAWYRTRKFVGRNKLAVASAAAAVVALAAGFGVALWEARRADREAATARAVTDFLQSDLLSQAGSQAQAVSGSRPDPDIKVRAALDRAAGRIGGKFASQPLVEAAIRDTMGNAYVELSLYAQAQPQMERALELRRSVLGPEHVETLTTMEHLAEDYRREGKFAAAEPLFAGVVDVDHRLKRDGARERLASMHALASIASDLRADYPRAEALYTQSLALERKFVGEADPLTLATMNNLAALYAREGKYPQAEDLYQRLLGAKRRVLGPDHPSTLVSMNGLGVLYRNQGKYTEAEALLKATLDARRRLMGEQHRDTLSSMNGLALVYIASGKYDAAEPLLNAAVEGSRRVLGETAPDTLTAVNSLGTLYRRQNKLDQAARVFQQLLDGWRRAANPGFTRSALVSLGEVRVQQEAFAKAEPLLREAVESYHVTNTDTWSRYYAQGLLGATLAGLGKNAEAAMLLNGSYQNLVQRQSAIPQDYRFVIDQIRQYAAPFSP
jgi:tetratricopeptide (TPR) repeat protein